MRGSRSRQACCTVARPWPWRKPSERRSRVTETARSVYRGRTSQVWEFEVADERQRKVCLVRLTVALVDNPVLAS